MAARRLRALHGHVSGSISQTIGPEPCAAADVYHGLLGSVDHSLHHGGELVAEVLVAHGVSTVFTLVGGHISPILVASEQRGVRILDVRHEVSTVFAADAVYRLTGVVGVAAVTAGPGVTNTVTALKNAAMAQSAVVLIGGAAASLTRGRGALQDIDQVGLLQTVCKKVLAVTNVREIVPMMRDAIQTATTGTPGPVFIEFPLDVIYNSMEVASSLSLLKRMRKRDVTRSALPRVVVPAEHRTGGVEAFLDGLDPEEPVFERGAASQPPLALRAFFGYQLRRMFSGAEAARSSEMGPLAVEAPAAKVSQTRRIVDLLKTAKRPVVLVGSQALLGGPSHAERLREALDRIGAPVFLGGMARGLLGKPLVLRHCRKAALKKADVVILAGTVCDFRLDYGRVLSKSSTVVAVNRSQADLKINTDAFWKPSVAVNACPGQLLADLGAAPIERRQEWLSELTALDAARDSDISSKAEVPAIGHGSLSGQRLLNPLALCRALDEALPDDVILVADGGDFVATAAYTVRPRRPLGWLDPGPFGTLGVGGGMALGAAVARPGSSVLILWGDGSCGYSIAEFDTFARFGIPVVALVGNDACWAQIEREQTPMFKSQVACNLAYAPYEQVAEGYGGMGISLNYGDDVSAVLREAFEVSRQQRRPVLVNAGIGKSDFREGSLSV